VGELHFFCDRSLGDRDVPERLREAGWVVTTMRERYGRVTAERLADVDWIADSQAEGEIFLTGDKAVAKRPLEARAVVVSRARVFALGNNQLTGQQKAERFLLLGSAIERRARTRPGPYVVSVNAAGLRTLDLNAE
jgi:hypothetical protein